MKSLGTAPGFHHVAIRAVDFDESVKFYTEGLGFRVHFPFSVPGRIDRAVFLDAGDGRFIELFGQGSTVQAEGRRRLPNEERTEGAMLHFCLKVTDTDASYARAMACRRGLPYRTAIGAAWRGSAGRGADCLRHRPERRGD
jgi:glyoxylase I family protein